MIGHYIKLSYNNLKRRKVRSGLTMLGVVISVTILFVLVSLSLGLESAVQEQFRQFGTDKFFIQAKGQLAGPGTGGAVQLIEEDIDVIEKISGVKDYSYFVIGNAKIEFRGQSRYVNVVGFPLDKSNVFLENGFYKIDEGRFIRDGDSGLVTAGYQYKYKNIFDTPLSAGDKIEINDKEFRISGIMKSLGNPQDDRMILMSIEDFRPLFNITDRVDQIIIQVPEGQDLDEVVSRVERKLRSTRDVSEKDQDFTILTPEEILASFGNILNILTGFLLGIAGISLLVGGIGIANTMYTSVLERTKEIGVMKAVGAKNSDILLLFTTESGLLGLAGGILSIILGIAIAKGIEYIAVVGFNLAILKVSFPFYLIIGCLVFAFIVGALSGAVPAYQASRIRPVDALRYE